MLETTVVLSIILLLSISLCSDSDFPDLSGLDLKGDGYDQIRMLFHLIPDTMESLRVLKATTFECFDAEISDLAQKVNYLSIAGIKVEAAHKGDAISVLSIDWNGRNLTAINWHFLREFRSLKSLRLNDNALSGSVNVSMFPPNLESLWLHQNEITNFELSLLSRFPDLRDLRLHKNRISESAKLRALPSRLERLDLSSNRLHGLIDFDSLKVPETLRWTDLRFNTDLKYKGNTKHIFRNEWGDILSFSNNACDWFLDHRPSSHRSVDC